MNECRFTSQALRENYQLIQCLFIYKWYCRPIFDLLRLRKIIKFVAARCQILRLATGGAYSYSAPSDPLARFKDPTYRGGENSAPSISVKSAPLMMNITLDCHFLFNVTLIVKLKHHRNETVSSGCNSSELIWKCKYLWRRDPAFWVLRLVHLVIN